MPPTFPASSKAGGQAFAMPDVCKTPVPPAGPVPIPYPNMAMLNQASATAAKVLLVNKEAVTKKSEIPRSSGDEGGTAGGVSSQTNMGKVSFKKCSAKVKFQGQPAAHLAATTAHNGAPNANAPAGTQVAPSQTKVLISG